MPLENKSVSALVNMQSVKQTILIAMIYMLRYFLSNFLCHVICWSQLSSEGTRRENVQQRGRMRSLMLCSFDIEFPNIIQEKQHLSIYL